tara:strand:- start:957 stop:2300 length:1344 start_codon:yes stop_codon:yes gene_type:complete
MDKVNLDINTYTLTELHNLLKLTKPYNQEDILNKKKKLENQISKSNINQNKKEELYIFLDNIKNKLISDYFNSLKTDDTKFNDVTKYDGNHFVIKNTNNQYASILENNKKINKSIIKKTFTIDSIFRTNYDYTSNKSHDYIIELPETITNALTMSISSLELPLSYHNISENLNNNIFRVEWYETNIDSTQNPIFKSKDIVLLSGLYESVFTSNSQIKAQNIQTRIQEALNVALAIDEFPYFKDDTIPGNVISTLKFIVNKTSGFSQFSYPGSIFENPITNVTINFNVDNNDAVEKCSQNVLCQKLGWQLGFRTNKIAIDESEDVAGNTHYFGVSSAICHIAYPRYLYIAIDDFQTSSRNYFAVASQSTIAPNIIARINILSCLEQKTAYKSAAQPGDYLYTNKHIREYFGPTNIKKLQIQLLDEFGRSFTLNNMDWSFVASWECFYN